MAFQPQSNPAPTSNRPAARGEFEKAAGFLNFYLPTKGGARRKLGTIALNASRPTEKAVFDLLVQDPDNMQKVLAALQVEFNPQIDEAAPENELAL